MDKKTAQKRQEGFLQVCLAEYTALRGEVISSLGTQRQLLSLELAVIGVAISGVTFFQAQPVLYLFAALLLSLLSWIMVEHTLKIQLIYQYFDTFLSDSLCSTLAEPVYPVWGWQTRWFSVSLRTIALAILALAKFILGFLLAISFCVLFVVAKSVGRIAWTREEIVVFAIDVIVLAIPALLGLLSVLALIRFPWMKRRFGQEGRSMDATRSET